MAKSRSRQLHEQSLELALAAIETYNKPRFPAREHTFQILMCAAWESMVKARILATSNHKLSSILLKERNGKFRKNRHGERLTISASQGMHRLNLDTRVIDNYEALEKLRDASVHMPIPSEGHKKLLFTVASATLKNYAELSRVWFRTTLSDVDWFILPLGFDFPFTRFTPIDVEQEPETIRQIVESFAAKTAIDYGDDRFSLMCHVDIELTSVNKLSPEQVGLTIGVDPNSNEQFAIRQRDKLDRYPLEYTQVLNKLKERCPCIKPNDLNSFIRDNGIKSNQRFSDYSYGSNRLMQNGPKKNTKSIYSHEFLSFVTKALAGNRGCDACPYRSKSGETL